MAGYLLWAGPLALLLVALVAVALVLRQRRAQSRRVRRTRPPASRPTAAPQTPASRLPPPAKPAKPAGPVLPPAAARGEGVAPQAGAAGSIAAQHEAAAEALRQARRRAATDAARLDSSRLAHGSAPVSPGAAPPPRPAPPTPPARPARPAAPVAAAAPPPPVSTPPPPFGARLTAPALTTLPPPRPAGPGQPLTVLVVDDSKVVRIKTSRLLEKHHYRVLLADDGLSAVACLETQSTDLLITDVEMPGLDGFGLTQRLRASPRWADLPVIMITSSDDKHRAEAAAAGVDVLLGKPYDEQALLAEVQRALARVQRTATARLVLQ